MHAMWKPQKFKYIYLIATLYVFTLTLPSASAMYWAFGDQLLNHSNAFSLLPKTRWRDAAVILMLIHQVSIFDFNLYVYNYVHVFFELLGQSCPLTTKIPCERRKRNSFPKENSLISFYRCKISVSVTDLTNKIVYSMHAVHHIWVCVHTPLLRVGEGDRNARHEKHMSESAR